MTFECPEWVPLFPLPSTVLLPRAIVPLHVFEPRYREMTADALAGGRVLAIGLLKPGYEPLYHTLDAEIHQIVGIGRIVREQRLDGGRYDLLLQGVARAAVVSEDHKRSYRRGSVRLLSPKVTQPDVECSLKRRLRSLLKLEPIATIAREAHWTDLLGCPGMSLSDAADVIAATALPRPEDKQHFLSQPCIEARVNCICNVLEALAERLRAATSSTIRRAWPPVDCDN